MHPVLNAVSRILLGCAFGATILFAQVDVSYRLEVTPDGAADGAYQVRMDVRGLAAGRTALEIPAWKPGAYRIENWFENIGDVEVEADGKALVLSRPDERSWAFDLPSNERLSVRWNGKTRHRANKNWMACEGPETWLYLRSALRAPCRLAVSVPEGWQVSMSLPMNEQGEFHAPDYDTFADCPLELGALHFSEFEIRGARIRNVFNMPPRFDVKRLDEICANIVEEGARIFGELPFDRYDFIWHLQSSQSFYGGLEHLYCTVLYIPMSALTRSVEDVASLIAHEFFHAWNVKRIRPFELGPFDYSKKVPVRGLWFSEGVTDYYADVLCMRAGTWSDERYILELKNVIHSVQANEAYGKESVEDASLSAFDRDMMDGGLDYYSCGKLLGLLLDIEIRAATKNARSLDDLMRALNEAHALPKPGFTDAELLKAASTIAGRDLTEWFQRHVSGREPYPFAETLPKAGIAYEIEETKVPARRSEIARMWRDVIVKATMGADQKEIWTVESSDRESIAAGDVILAIGESTQFSPAVGQRSFLGRNVAAGIAPREEKDAVTLKLRRGEQDIVVELPISKTVRRSIAVSRMIDAPESAREIYDGIFHPRRK